MKYSYFLILFILSCTPPLPQEDNNQFSDCNAPYGYNCGDISVLQKFIEINSSPEKFRHYMDYNENDILEPIEFGYQVWDRGRLIQLNLNYSTNVIMQEDNITELDPTNYRLTKIPNNIGELTGLESLFLHNNALSDVPESIGNLSKLIILDLENNMITDLPSSSGNLVNLERLVLSSNRITSLPESIGSLKSLKRLWLQNNQLVSLPDSLVSLIQLEWLYFNNNLLEKLPDGIGNLVNLKLLNIENNMISSLPESMCDEINGNISMYEGLEAFSIRDNQFCKEEDGLIELPSCIDLEYGNQNCSNCHPWEFNIEGYCADSTDYNILQNFLNLNSKSIEEGLIPRYAYGAKNADWWHEGRLVEINFHHKQLNSTIPENFGNLEKLKILRLTGNYLRGGIPESITNLKELKILKLNSNYLSGSIPQNIGELSMIDTIWLTDNSLGCYDYDYECDEHFKTLHNTKEFCCITHCDITNDCSAIIPESITDLTQLQVLQLEENLISGIIPSNIGEIDSLKYLYLDNNLIVGEIPNSLGNLSILRRLKLHRNDLRGQIPENICNLYENDLGPQFSFRAYFNNNNFCPGALGYPECIPESHLGYQKYDDDPDCFP